MRAVIQRVSQASVRVDGEITGQTGPGLMVLLGVGQEDTEDDVRWMADKVAKMRIFEDDEGKMNRSVLDVGGGLLVVSQFTLFGDCRKGNRPGYSDAARPELAKALYERFVEMCRSVHGLQVGTGIFQAHMEVSLVNDGPVTLMVDSRKTF